MSVWGEGQTPNNKRETKTILNLELLFARLVVIHTLTRKKGIAAVAVV